MHKSVIPAMILLLFPVGMLPTEATTKTIKPLTFPIEISIFQWAAEKTGCPEWILRGIAGTESQYTPGAVGDQGRSLGMFQINETFRKERTKKHGFYNPLNPLSAALEAGKIMQENLAAFPDTRDAIAAYRQGIRGVLTHGRTEWYVSRVVWYATISR